MQELLASKKLEFYDSAWNSIGTLQDEGPRNLNELGNEISEITKVAPEALLGRVPLWEYSVEARMSWASSRKSGRPEDIAYSLLGIFGLYMPLIYGEGARAAFQRLQLEIIKSTPDLSLFAWHTGQPHLEGQFCGILADSPSQFKFNRRICRSIPGSHHTMTNKGIQMTAVLRQVPTDKNSRFFLCLEYQGEHSKAVGILLRKIGYNVFQRAEESITEIEDLDKHPSTHRSTIYITTSPQQHDPERPRLDDGSIHVPSEYAVFDLLPEASWDCESRILLGSMPCSDGIRALKLAIQKSNGPPVMVGLVFRSSNIIAFDCGRYVEISERLFTRTHRRSSMNWDELLSKIPNLRSFSNQVNIPNVVNLRAEVLPCSQHPFQPLIDMEPISAGPSRITASLPDVFSLFLAEVTGNARDPLETASQARTDLEVFTHLISRDGSSKNKMVSSILSKIAGRHKENKIHVPG